MPYQRRLSSEPSLGGGGGFAAAPVRSAPQNELQTLLNAYAASNSPYQLSPYFGLEGSIESALRDRLEPPAYTPLDPAWQRLRSLDTQEDQFNRGLAAQERLGSAQLGAQERIAGIEAQARALPSWADLDRRRELDRQGNVNRALGGLFGEDARQPGGGQQPAAAAAPPGPYGALYANRTGDGPYDTFYSGAQPQGQGPSAPAPGAYGSLGAGQEPWQRFEAGVRSGAIDPETAGYIASRTPDLVKPPVPLERQAAEASTKAAATEQGAANVKFANALSSKADSALERLDLLGSLESALKNAPQGGWNPAIAQGFANVFNLFGAKGDVLLGVADAQTAQGLMSDLVINAMKRPDGSAGGLGSGVSDRDIELQKERFPRITDLAERNQKTIQMLRRLAELDIERDRAFGEFSKGKGAGQAGQAEFSRAWREQRKGADSFADIFDPEWFGAAAQRLRQDPSQAAVFDRTFYPGAAAKILGGQ